MNLVENIHFETVEILPGHFVYEGRGGPPWGYCADIRDGKAIVLRRTHPDICDDDLIAEAERLRARGKLRSRKEFDMKRRKRNNG